MAIYDKMEGESAKAFAAFAAYRDLGTSRSVDNAYLQTGAKQGKNSSKKAPTHWWQWAAEYDWKKRAGAFDDDEDKRRRSELAETHRQELEAYRTRIISRARGLADAAADLMKFGLDGMETVDLSKMKPGDIPGFISVAAMALEKAAKLEGIGLGVLGENGEPLEQAA